MFNSHVEFHWQFLITYYGFWLVNILLRKFSTSSRKEMRIIKNKNFDEKQEKYQESKWKYKVAFFTATGIEVNHCKLWIAISFQEFAVKIVTSLKSDSHIPKKKNICFNDSPSKMMKNAFYFILKLFTFSRYLNFCLDFLAM